jgi:hypothetical protein
MSRSGKLSDDSTCSSSDTALRIGGSASAATKLCVSGVLNTVWRPAAAGFADPVGKRMRITEVDIDGAKDAPAHEEARVVVEIVVEEGVCGLAHSTSGLGTEDIQICSTAQEYFTGRV